MASQHDIINSQHDSKAGAQRVLNVDENGAKFTPATEETLQALLAASGGAYAIAYGKNVLDAGHYYTAYQAVGGTAWRIKRINATTSSIEWASGADNLAAAWAAKTSQNYSYTI